MVEKTIEYTWLSETQIKKLLRDPDLMAKLEKQTNDPNIKELLFWTQLWDWFSKNDSYVFFNKKQIDWANPRTFEVLWYLYAKDKDSVYYGVNKLKWWIKYSTDANPNSFKVYNWWLALDDNFVYVDWLTVLTYNISYIPVESKLFKLALEWNNNTEVSE